MVSARELGWRFEETHLGREECFTLPALSAAVGIGERCVHGVDRNRRYDAREKEPADTNPDRKCARERLPRYDIAITNREAGDEGEIKCDQPSTKPISKPRAN